MNKRMKIKIPNGVSELQIKFKKQTSLSDFLTEIYQECCKQTRCLDCPYRDRDGNDVDGYGSLFAGDEYPSRWDESKIEKLVKDYENQNAND